MGHNFKHLKTTTITLVLGMVFMQVSPLTWANVQSLEGSTSEAQTVYKGEDEALSAIDAASLDGYVDGAVEDPYDAAISEYEEWMAEQIAEEYVRDAQIAEQFSLDDEGARTVWTQEQQREYIEYHMLREFERQVIEEAESTEDADPLLDEINNQNMI